MTQLSPHFALEELLRTEHRNIDNTPSDPKIVSYLTTLANNFLEPVRDHFGPLFVSSGYRCPALNSAIGGVADSAHIYGCAADLIPIEPGITPTDMVIWIAQQSGLQFDQVIDEGTYTARWCHLGMLRPDHEPAPRLQALLFRNGVYTPFQPSQSNS